MQGSLEPVSFEKHQLFRERVPQQPPVITDREGTAPPAPFMFEYEKDNQGSWKFQKLPDIPKEFQEELTRIGGLNRFGKPNLKVVKGNEELSDRDTHKGLKYLAGFAPQDVKGYRYRIDGEWKFSENIDDLDPSVMVYPAIERQPLGLLRYVIERWVSPEELGETGRFQTRYASGDLAPVLRSRPAEGVYDLYQIVETREGKFRKLDKDVLNFIKMRWKYEQIDERAKLQDEERAEAYEKIQKERSLEDIWEAAANLDLRLDPEERERRDAFWAAYDQYIEDAKRYEGTATFYQYA